MNQKILDANGVVVSTDRSLLDLTFTYRYLHDNMYWAKTLTFDDFERAVAHSAVVGAYDSSMNGQLVGFARVISDCATFAYLTDVFVVSEYRGQGLSMRIMEIIVNHPELQGLRRFLLVTEDAQGLYAKFGFEPLKDGTNWMQIKGNVRKKISQCAEFSQHLASLYIY